MYTRHFQFSKYQGRFDINLSEYARRRIKTPYQANLKRDGKSPQSGVTLNAVWVKAGRFHASISLHNAS